jgi:hypothetical protein
MRNNYDLEVTCNAVMLREEMQCSIFHFNRIFNGETVPLDSYKETVLFYFFQLKARILSAQKLIQFFRNELSRVQ